MFYRCANDIVSGYCNSEPEWNIKPQRTKEGDLMGGLCRLNPKICGKYYTLTEQVKATKEKLAAAKSRSEGGLL